LKRGGGAFGFLYSRFVLSFLVRYQIKEEEEEAKTAPAGGKQIIKY